MSVVISSLNMEGLYPVHPSIPTILIRTKKPPLLYRDQPIRHVRDSIQYSVGPGEIAVTS